MRTEELLFELSHPVRFEILQLIAEEPERLKKIAESVEVGNPEVSRHLDRLRAAGIVEKNEEGAFIATPLGSLILSFLPGLDFLAANSEYFLVHDLSLLPPHFIGRLGELNNSRREEGGFHNVGRVIDILRSTEHRLKLMTKEILMETVPIVEEKLSQGLKFQGVYGEDIIFPENYELPPPHLVRFVPKIPAGAVVTEKVGGITFLDRKGAMDFSVSFWSTDRTFMEWIEDLIDFYWEQGKSLK